MMKDSDQSGTASAGRSSGPEEFHGKSLVPGNAGNIRVMKTQKNRGRGAVPFFVTRCEARMNDVLFPANGLLVSVGQLIRESGLQKIWESILLRCEEESDGTLAIRVIVAHPEWEQLLQIACIRSRPHDPESLTPLACNLDHEEVPE